MIQHREYHSQTGSGFWGQVSGVHENFGVGAKTSLLPWNRHGIVVVSWVDGEASMIWLRRSVESGEYGLQVEEAIDPDTGELALDEVFTPYNDADHCCDWSAIKPEWIDDHGTVIVLLGDKQDTDTVLGDPDRDESDIKGISAYLNRRIWMLPCDVEIYVEELRGNDRSTWPSSESSAYGSPPAKGKDRRVNKRKIEGAQHFINYPSPTFKKGLLASSGTLPLHDGTEVDWFLWQGDRPAVQSYAAFGGYIAALYKNELYDIHTHQATYRSFGIGEKPSERTSGSSCVHHMTTATMAYIRARIETPSCSEAAEMQAAHCH